MAGQVELGCGLIAIGRPWGTTPEVPSEQEALSFLESAYELGIRHFDTAPSYGYSEERLGTFLSRLSAAERCGVFVSSKCGESWDPDTQAGSVDHSYEALQTSISRSLAYLGEISLMQIHKTTPEVLYDHDVDKAIAFCRTQGIGNIGASVSDVATAELVLEDERFQYLQLPCNATSPQFKKPIIQSQEYGKQVLTNRPFQMGAVTGSQEADRHKAAVAAFAYILQIDFKGIVLTGTSSPGHLSDNLAAFEEARSLVGHNID